MHKKFTFNKTERTDFSNFNCHYSKNYNVFKHSHDDYYEVIITLGDFYETVDGQTYLRKIKDVTILRPDTTHAINVIDENSCHYNLAIRKKYFESFIENKTALNNYLKNNGYLSFTLDEQCYQYVTSLIGKINNTKYDYLSLTLVESILYALCSCILPLLIDDNECDDKILCYVKDAVEKISDGTFIKKTLKEIYASYPLSHTTFIKNFKEFVGKTPSEYLTDKKLEYAKTLLLTTKTSVLDISMQIGFESVSHFIRIFKIKYGLTPLKLRKIDFNNKNPELVK